MSGLARDLRSIALLLDQGQPLSQTLRRLSTQNAVWLKAAEQAEAGAGWAQLSQSLPPLLARLRPTEENLPESLRLCARFLEDIESRRRFWRQIRLYPTLLAVAGLILGLFVSLVVRSEIQLLGTSVSGPIQMMTWLASLYLRCFPVLMWFPLLLAGLLHQPRVRMHFPLLGFSVRLHESVSFLRWLELALRHQPGLPEAIQTASQACQVDPMRLGMVSLAESLRQGSDLTSQLARQSWLPSQFRWALGQAQASGFRSRQLLALADLIEHKLVFYRNFTANMLALGGYLLAAGMCLWCSLCVLLPLIKVAESY